MAYPPFSSDPEAMFSALFGGMAGGAALNSYTSELQLQATAALEARDNADPRWTSLLYRLQSWSAQHQQRAMSESEVVAKLEALAN